MYNELVFPSKSIINLLRDYLLIKYLLLIEFNRF